MALTISRTTLCVSLVVLVIVVIITLIAIRSRSKYAYPDASAALKNAITVSTVAAAGASYPGVVTITTVTAHGLVAGDVILNGVTALVVLSAPAPTTTPPHTFSVSATAASVPTGTVLTPAYKTLTDALEQCNITQQNSGFPTAAGKTFNQCIDDSTIAYYSSMCPWTSVTATASMPATVSSAYTTYQNQISSTSGTADPNSVGKAYTAIKNAANTPMIVITNAARKADITGATRKYLSTVCPNYYTSASGTATPSNYSTWGVFATAAAATTAGVPYYFDASRVKFASAADKTSVANRIKEWAKYAAVYDLLNPGTTTGPLITGCNLYNTMSADGVTPNWKLAQQYGPGTVAGITLPWNTVESTCNTAYNTYAAALN
jgi:hypothetical protein